MASRVLGKLPKYGPNIAQYIDDYNSYNPLIFAQYCQILPKILPNMSTFSCDFVFQKLRALLQDFPGTRQSTVRRDILRA